MVKRLKCIFWVFLLSSRLYAQETQTVAMPIGQSQQPDVNKNVREEIVEKDGLFAFRGKGGKYTIPFDYTYLNRDWLKNNFIAVKNGKYGIINEDNQIVLPFEYDLISAEPRKYYIVKKGISYALFHDNGKWMTPLIYQSIKTKNAVGYFFVKENSKIGLLDTTGAILISPQYKDITLIPSSTMINTGEANDRFIVTATNNYKGVVNRLNEIKLPIQYDSINQVHGDFCVVKWKSKWGAFNKNYELIVPMEYDRLENLGRNANYISIVSKNGKYRLVNIQGRQINESAYDAMTLCSYSFVCTVVQGKKGLLDANGKVILPNEFVEIDPFNFENGPYRVFAKKDKLLAMFDEAGTRITNYEFEEFRYHLLKNTFSVRKNNKWGLINLNGKVIKDFVFDSIYPSLGVVYGIQKGSKVILGYYKM